MYFHGACFSNYEAWLSDPTHIGPSALVVWSIVHQEILNVSLIPRCRIYVKSPFSMATRPWFSFLDGAPKFITFCGRLNPVIRGLWLTDMAHHHLTIVILFLVVGYMYRTNWGDLEG
ncbi:unnamed protein product [Malus baccata var. baccata]